MLLFVRWHTSCKDCGSQFKQWSSNMSKVEHNPGKDARSGTYILSGFLALALMLFALNANSASISGQALNTEGEVLIKVSVCLAQASTPQVCEKVQRTNKKGTFSFSGLKPGSSYIVAANRDRSAANRKTEQYANYVWEPNEHRVTITSRKEKRSVGDFVGKFNFSNCSFCNCSV